MLIESWSISGNGFHFGRHGLGQEKTAITLSSDSLFAALIDRIAILEGKDAVDTLMASFLSGDTPFVLTSTYVFGGEVRFFPMPARVLWKSEEGISIKELKKVRFISERLFLKFISGVDVSSVYKTAIKIQGGAVLCSSDETSLLPQTVRDGQRMMWKEETRPRVVLGRYAQNSTIFNTGRVTYPQGCGLWFGIRWLKDDASLNERFAEWLVELGDAGLGAERSTGFGMCEIRPFGNFDLPDPSGKSWVSLSRYLPCSDEVEALKADYAAYNVVNVSGWLDSPVRRGQRRRAIHMLGEGAVLGMVDRIIPGQVVDVRPSYPKDPDPVGHAAYRCGLGFAVDWRGGDR